MSFMNTYSIHRQFQEEEPPESAADWDMEWIGAYLPRNPKFVPPANDKPRGWIAVGAQLLHRSEHVHREGIDGGSWPIWINHCRTSYPLFAYWQGLVVACKAVMLKMRYLNGLASNTFEDTGRPCDDEMDTCIQRLSKFVQRFEKVVRPVRNDAHELQFDPTGNIRDRVRGTGNHSSFKVDHFEPGWRDTSMKDFKYSKEIYYLRSLSRTQSEKADDVWSATTRLDNTSEAGTILLEASCALSWNILKESKLLCQELKMRSSVVASASDYQKLVEANKTAQALATGCLLVLPKDSQMRIKGPVREGSFTLPDGHEGIPLISECDLKSIASDFQASTRVLCETLGTSMISGGG